MTLELDLPPELEARLRAEAARLGITAEEYAVQLIMAALDKMDLEEAP